MDCQIPFLIFLLVNSSREMSPKKDKGKTKKIPPKRGLTNVRSWFQATAFNISNTPMKISNESSSGSSKNVPNQPSSFSSQLKENEMSIILDTNMVKTQELFNAIANALQQQQIQALQPQPMTPMPISQIGLQP